ncbi:c-type cytochrome [Denitromonas iodatirespirans]|uniref:Cytochrome c n=1 Tax=Denitromonas iodatirespirans TaxID=2795389 RepID=A0A944DGD4_DENI1|nr:cytochrome c [Denitromonas iodatirespirans]MBT0963707.1 cytochrome c [Denitromonas iodatirespirans]
MSPTPREPSHWLLRTLLWLPWLLALIAAIYALGRFTADIPVAYAEAPMHFKYGSTGGERESGFPYWIWQALPKVCPEHLPGEGYRSIGFTYEPGKDLPVGVSKRFNLGIDRVFLNCAACHVSTVRDAPGAAPRVILGMPAHRLDIKAFETFFFNCAAGPKFRSEFIVPQIEAMAGRLSPLDRYVVYPVAIALMRERLLMLRDRFAFAFDQPDWGPGRVDTFNSAKVLFNFPMHQLPKKELLGASDFPSIWLQGPRMKRDDGQRMELHWDGNNTRTEERNKSAAFGTGTTPPTIDLRAIGRIEQWLLDLTPPPWPYAIDKEKAERGRALYAETCAACHGASGRDFSGKYVGHVTPIQHIATDRARLDSYTYTLAVNQGTLYAGYPHRFQHFRKTFGYANMPLDGLWLRGPYLHNGSVPTVRDLLEPADARPASFYRGNDVIDRKRLGFVSNVASEPDRQYFLFDTTAPGNGNTGHEGAAYGTTLAPEDKDAIVEYLKTF